MFRTQPECYLHLELILSHQVRPYRSRSFRNPLVIFLALTVEGLLGSNELPGHIRDGLFEVAVLPSTSCCETVVFRVRRRHEIVFVRVREKHHLTKIIAVKPKLPHAIAMSMAALCITPLSTLTEIQTND